MKLNFLQHCPHPVQRNFDLSDLIYLLETEGSKTARNNQFFQTNVRGKLLKDDPNLTGNTFCTATDVIDRDSTTFQFPRTFVWQN